MGVVMGGRMGSRDVSLVEAGDGCLAHLQGEPATRPAWTRSTPPATSPERSVRSSSFSSLGEFGRIAMNVEAVYREFDPTHDTPDVVEQFRRMAPIES